MSGKKTINDAAHAAEEAADAKASTKATPDASAEEAAPLADWQQADYNGPLDTEQAAWRNQHLQPWRDHATKPAAEPETK